MLIAFSITALCQGKLVSLKKDKSDFPLTMNGKSAALYISDSDYPGVIRAFKDLQADIKQVTDTQAELFVTNTVAGENVVIAGTIGKSTLIDRLVSEKKLNVSDVAGKWESFVVEKIINPFPGVSSALVIAGSDKRGTIFGIYEISRNIGVSPWYWWADVPAKKSEEIFVRAARYVQGEPGVKYRGIFINDEEPALGRWAVEKYGGFTHEFYEKVFELILRMKGNYLWPAMWWASFNTDDQLNPKLADEYGIVMSTTHHEPMMRAHSEWKKSNGGAWNYETNAEKLRAFWTDGIQRMGNRESIVSMGMRGDGDMAMTAETNIALLERIVKDQREIIEKVTGKKASATPQLWALYKEVQDYYDKGMRVPDDVTLLLCDDNWGNIRKLPKPKDAPRSGGYGIYYHFDYVGGPRNYKWLNTNPISRVWEQMHLAYEYGATTLWLVNVGDIKPVEFPIEFFLDYAWDPKKINEKQLGEYTTQWAEEQFGSGHATEIADILSKYTKYNGRRKPELLSPATYNLTSFREAERVVSDYNALAAKAEKIYQEIPGNFKDAYYQLVLFPVIASANLNELFVTVGKNRLYANQGRAETNALAEKAKTLFAKDSSLAAYYNKTLSGGKWNHMMDQTHISYTYWQQPAKDVLPEVKHLELKANADMGVAIEGSSDAWPGSTQEATLPEFDPLNNQKYTIEIFNRGSAPFNCTVKTEKPYVHVSASNEKVEKALHVIVSVDWKKAPSGISRVPLTITGGEKSITVVAIVNNKPTIKSKGFVESNHYISIEAEHFSKAVNKNGVSWTVIPDLGKTLSGVTTFPVTSPRQTISNDGPHLEYEINIVDTGRVNVVTYCSPTIDFTNSDGLHYAISIDDEPPVMVNLHADTSPRAWERSVADNILKSPSKHTIKRTGSHTLKFWVIDPGVVLQKIVIETGKVPDSYLGPPESFRNH